MFRLEKRYAEAVPLLEARAQAGEATAGLFFALATSYDNLRVAPQAIDYYEKFISYSQGRDDAREWQARQRIKVLRRKSGN